MRPPVVGDPTALVRRGRWPAATVRHEVIRRVLPYRQSGCCVGKASVKAEIAPRVADVVVAPGPVGIGALGLAYPSQVAVFFFSSRRRHTRLTCDWSSDVCSSD